MKKRTTLKDIAEKLGVSTTLVSYVLNNKEKEGRVGAKMVKKIRETAAQLNYRPNYSAKSLKSNKRMSIGCIVADIANPFFADLIRKVEDEASKFGYTVIFSSSEEDITRFKDIIEVLLYRQLDGFLIAPPEGGREVILKLKETKIPTVLFDRYYDDVGLNCVVLDNYTGAKRMMQSLFESGRKRIGMIGYESNMNHFNQRKAGYIDALKDAKIKTRKKLLKTVNFNNLQAEVHQAVEDLITHQSVDAIFFETNSLIQEGLKYIAMSDYNIPKDLEVAAFDESELYYFFEYPIKYVKQPLQEMAETAVKKLIDEIENKDIEVGIEYLTPTIVQEYKKPKSIIKG